MFTSLENNTADEAGLRVWIALLTLVDIALMFLGIFVANATAWWIWIPFHVVVFISAACVLYLAHRASRYVPNSIPFQKQIGTFLYLSCHLIQGVCPANVPLAIVAYLIFAGPISLWFLFDHLFDD